MSKRGVRGGADLQGVTCRQNGYHSLILWIKYHFIAVTA